MNSWQKKGTNKRDLHQDEPSPHTVCVCLPTTGEIPNLFGELHWMEGFCEYFSARHSNPNLSFVQIWIFLSIVFSQDGWAVLKPKIV